MKAKLFWHRLSLALDILELVREHSQNNPQKEDIVIDVVPLDLKFRTNFAQMIWDIAKDYETIRSVVLIALHDAELYNFDLSSSINSTMKDDVERHSKSAGVHFKKLVRARLLEHIYHVVFYASTFKDEAYRQMPALILVALLHDFGKHEAIIKNHSSPKSYLSHEEISANYAQYIMKKAKCFSDDFIKTITVIIATHHNNPGNGILYKYLNKADFLAREQEIR